MAEVKLVKSIYTGANITSLGELAPTDTFPPNNAPAVLGRTDTANSWSAQQTFKETKDTVFAITDTSPDIDPVNGNVQTIALTANRTLTAANFDDGQCILLGIDDGNAYAITAWPTLTWVSSTGSQTAPALAATGFTWFLLWKIGTTLYGSLVGKSA